LHRQMEANELRDYHRGYAEVIRASKFVLCPRGLSVSTVRLFETMRMGRVPVILSNGWVEPEGPRWDDFAIRVAEGDCARIPRLLEGYETKARSMGELAREQWLEWFSDEVAFHRVVQWCLAIQKRRTLPERLGRWPAYLQYFERFHLRRAIGTKVRAFKKTMVRS
jgi:Exostosin family